MNDSKLIEKIWQLSVVDYTPDDGINPNTKHLIGWLHITELILTIICISTTTLRYLIILKTSQIKMLHINMKVIIHHTIMIFYTQQILRVVQFLFAFTDFFQDISIFGPLKILYFIREACLMIEISTFSILTTVLTLSTINPEWYERHEHPLISCALILFMYVYIIVIEFLHYRGFISMIFMPVMAILLSLINLPFLIWVYKKNKYYLSRKYNLSLNKKFQILENIRICQTLIPAYVGLSFFIAIFGALYFLVYVMSEDKLYETSLMLSTMFNFCFQLLIITLMLVILFGLREFRVYTMSFLCGKLIQVRRNQISPVRDEQQVYFDQLKAMWEAPLILNKPGTVRV